MRATVPLVVLLLLASAPAALARPHWGWGDEGPRGRAAPFAETLAAAGNATLVVVVNASDANATFSFSATGGGLPASFSIATHDGTGQATFANLTAGNASLAEAAPGGWFLAAAACDAGAPGNATLADNATTTCWFDNARTASLTVEVDAQGADGSFNFTATGAGVPATFTVATTNGTGHVRFAGLRPGNVTLAQVVPAGWRLDDATCDANVTLASGDDVTCAFTDVKLTFLRILVETRGGDGNFTLRGNGSGLPSRFHVETDGGRGETGFVVDANETLNVTLRVPSGWKLDAGACDGVKVPANATVTCRFVLARLASIVATVNATGGDGTFVLHLSVDGGAPTNTSMTTENGLAAASFPDLDPDAHYTLTLTGPSRWSIGPSPCVDVVPGAGAALSCDFEATRLGAAAGRVTNAANGAPLAGFVVFDDRDHDGHRDATEPRAFTNASGGWWIGGLSTGAHTFRVVLPAGWVAVDPASGMRNASVSAGVVRDGLDFRVRNATVTPPSGDDDDDDHDGHHEGSDHVGGGPGYWKNWRNHHTEAQVTAWVHRVHASWSMPESYAPNADGLRALIIDSEGQCVREMGKRTCDELRAAVRELVERLNELAS